MRWRRSGSHPLPRKLKEVKSLTCGLDLNHQVGRRTSVILVDVTCRDDDPEVVDVRGDDDGLDEDDDDEDDAT